MAGGRPSYERAYRTALESSSARTHLPAFIVVSCVLEPHMIRTSFLLVALAACTKNDCPKGYTLDEASGHCLEGGDTGSVEDSDADTDSDTDSDSDADTDTDADSDADSDADTDTGGLDVDGDGFAPADGDCDDNNATAFPGAAEIADSIDNDCDGYLDEWEVCASGGDYSAIQSVLDDAQDGQLVLVCAGTYFENIDFAGTDSRLVSRDGPSVTTLDGGDSDPVVSIIDGETEDALLMGFTITNGRGRGACTNYFDCEGGGVYVSDASPTISGNIISANQAYIGAGIYVYGSLSHPRIEQNIVSENVGEISNGVLAIARAGADILNNVIADNDAQFSGTIDFANTGLTLADTLDVLIENNTIVGNEASQSYYGANITIYNSADAVIINNIFGYGSVGYGIGGSSGATYSSCEYNDFWNNDAGDVRTDMRQCGSSNQEVDPVFVSRSGHDYHLQASSGCVDAADPDMAYNDTDGSRGDLGGYGGPLGDW